MEKTKILLSKALLELLESKSFENIKVIEICDKALVHKTTFYNHFEDKYELLNYVLVDIHNKIKDNAIKNQGIIEYYLSIARSYINYIKKNPTLFKSIIALNDESIGVRIFYNIYINDIENEIKDKIDIPVNYVAHFYVTAVFSIISEWFLNGMIEDEDTLIKYIKILIKTEKKI